MLFEAQLHVTILTRLAKRLTPAIRMTPLLPCFSLPCSQKLQLLPLWSVCRLKPTAPKFALVSQNRASLTFSSLSALLLDRRSESDSSFVFPPLSCASVGGKAAWYLQERLIDSNLGLKQSQSKRLLTQSSRARRTLLGNTDGCCRQPQRGRISATGCRKSASGTPICWMDPREPVTDASVPLAMGTFAVSTYLEFCALL